HLALLDLHSFPTRRSSDLQVAKGYGMDTFTATNNAELEEAVEQTKQSHTSTLIHIKVLPKTMTAGYEGFWNVGVSEASSNSNVRSEEHTSELQSRFDLVCR